MESLKRVEREKQNKSAKSLFMFTGYQLSDGR